MKNIKRFILNPFVFVFLAASLCACEDDTTSKDKDFSALCIQSGGFYHNDRCVCQNDIGGYDTCSEGVICSAETKKCTSSDLTCNPGSQKCEGNKMMTCVDEEWIEQFVCSEVSCSQAKKKCGECINDATACNIKSGVYYLSKCVDGIWKEEGECPTGEFCDKDRCVECTKSICIGSSAFKPCINGRWGEIQDCTKSKKICIYSSEDRGCFFPSD